MTVFLFACLKLCMWVHVMLMLGICFIWRYGRKPADDIDEASNKDHFKTFVFSPSTSTTDSDVSNIYFLNKIDFSKILNKMWSIYIQCICGRVVWGTGHKAKQLVLQCINGASSNPVEERTKICRLKDLILTLFSLIFRRIYIYLYREMTKVFARFYISLHILFKTACFKIFSWRHN